MSGLAGAAVETAPHGAGRTALKAAGKSFAPLGYGLDVLAATNGYDADVKRGVPKRRALIDNGSELTGAVLGGLAGSALGPWTAVAGGYLGGKVGKAAPQAARDTVQMAKQLLRELDAMQDPRYFPSRREPRW